MKSTPLTGRIVEKRAGAEYLRRTEKHLGSVLNYLTDWLFLPIARAEGNGAVNMLSAIVVVLITRLPAILIVMACLVVPTMITTLLLWVERRLPADGACVVTLD